MDMQNVETTAKAIEEFVTDLRNSCCQGDRRESVMFLANKLGADAANQIAAIFGLKDGYYKF